MLPPTNLCDMIRSFLPGQIDGHGVAHISDRRDTTPATTVTKEAKQNTDAVENGSETAVHTPGPLPELVPPLGQRAQRLPVVRVEAQHRGVRPPEERRGERREALLTGCVLRIHQLSTGPRASDAPIFAELPTRPAARDGGGSL